VYRITLFTHALMSEEIIKTHVCIIKKKKNLVLLNDSTDLVPAVVRWSRTVLNALEIVLLFPYFKRKEISVLLQK
jgi:hypothetical protein